MSTADKLNKLLETKEAIKQAIIDKGGTVGDVFADYPTAIQNIQSGGSGTFVVPAGMRFAYSTIENFPDNWDWSEFEKENSLSSAFKNCSYLKKAPKLNLTSATTSIEKMFELCAAIQTYDMSGWDTSNVTNMSGIFGNCAKLKSIDFGKFDTSKNQNFRNMFDACESLDNIPELNATSNTSSYSSKSYSPIYRCYSLRSFGGLKGINKTWYAESAYSLSYQSLLNIINGLAAGVSGQTLYLHQDLVNQLSDDDIAIATNKGWSISPSKTITEPVVVTDLSQIPSSTYNVNPRTYDFSQYSGSWNSGSSSALKCDPYSFEADLSSTTDASYMFYNKNLCNVILINTQNVTDMDHIFANCTKLTSIYISDLSNVTNMTGMFINCKNLRALTQLDTSNVTKMGQMFLYCNSLTTVRLNTQNVIEMGQMFDSCSSLESVTMVGGVENLLYTTVMFHNVKPNGTFYYDDRYDYSKIIAVLPETWTAVPITV